MRRLPFCPILVLPFVFLVLCAAPIESASAQTAPCAAAISTAAMRSCEQDRLDKANGALQTVYTRLLGQLGASSKIKLKASEAAWLLYRKAEADFQADAAQGGTLAPLLRTTTLADLTEERSTSLGKSVHP